ncbi:glycosyl hydrolase [Kitasatospora sp. NPDC088346]|uniref:glycoside hydrolase 5 family protein n=1 Tax=Kitasatospora sp. NPDC088346 TaxID=3364073 RepID=UPI00382E340B
MTTQHPPGTDRLRFGADHVPSAGRLRSWLDFSADAARRDFEDLAGLGLDHVRVLPIWPWIQPSRSLIRRRGIDDLLELIDVAAEFALEVAVDLWQGHLASFDLLPSWVPARHQYGVRTDALVRTGLTAYVEQVCRAVATRANVFAVTLGPEADHLRPAERVDPAERDDRAEQDVRTAELLAAARAAAPRLLTLCPLDGAARHGPGQPVTGGPGGPVTVRTRGYGRIGAREDPLGPAATSHADYLVELAAASSADPLRPVWLQEVGVPRPEVPATEAAAVRLTIDQVAANPALWGITWRCSHDTDRRAAGFPDVEGEHGLFTVDRRRTPAASQLASRIAELRARRALAVDRPALVCDLGPDTPPGHRTELAPGGAFHAEWVRLRRAGPLAVLPAHRAEDGAYLAARRIGTVLART